MRRWGASPNTFTLDFGDYADQYYSVQTTEAEQIVQLIAGYIDIILKKKQSKDHFGIEGDEGSTMVEESVAPFKWVLFSYLLYFVSLQTQPFRASIIQQEITKVGKVNEESVYKPVLIRGTDGEFRKTFPFHFYLYLIFYDFPFIFMISFYCLNW